MVTEETKQASQSFDIDPEPCRISQAFASSVTKDCFQSLIVLLRWSWTMLKSSMNEHKDKVSRFRSTHLFHHYLSLIYDVEYFTQKNTAQIAASINNHYYVSKVCLRLMKKYTNEIYPNNAPKAACIAQKRKGTTAVDKADLQNGKSYKLITRKLYFSNYCFSFFNVQRMF